MTSNQPKPRFKVGDLVVWNGQTAAPVNKVYWYEPGKLPGIAEWRVQSRGVDAPERDFRAA